MRICLVSERLSPPYDEGIKNYAYQLARGLSMEHELTVLTAFAPRATSADEVAILNIPTNKLFVSLELMRAVRGQRPDLVIYIPTASATLFSFVRARMLKRYAGGAPVVMVALQWRPYGRLARLAMPHVAPDLIVVQSRVTHSSLEPFGLHMAPIAPGIDLHRFRPLSREDRHRLRLRYDLDLGAFVVLHVGHLNRGRNVQALIEVQRRAQIPNLQCLVVGSSSTDQDRVLVDELEAAGVQVIDGHVEEIEKVYGLADCYLFPVNGRMSAIDLPLSVLEAMACDLAVVTTRFGGLVSLFSPSEGFCYASTIDEMIASIEACCDLQEAGTREMVAPYDWRNATRHLMSTVQRELGTAGRSSNRRLDPSDG